MYRNRGFTLIELLITVAIAVIIMGVAYPSYLDQVRGSRRAECSGGLAGLSNAMERHFTVSGSYLGAAEGGADIGTPAVFVTNCPIDGGDPTYNLSITAATVSTFSIQAEPIGPQTNDSCGTMTLTNTGQKGVIDADPGYDWERCWK